MSREGSQRSGAERAALPTEGQRPAPAEEEARGAMTAQGPAGMTPEQRMAYAQQMLQMALSGSGFGGFPPPPGFGFGGQFPGFPGWAPQGPPMGGYPGGMSLGGPPGPQVLAEEVSPGGTPGAGRPGRREGRQLMGPPSRSPTPRQTPSESVCTGSSSKSRTQTPTQRGSPRAAERRRVRSPKNQREKTVPEGEDPRQNLLSWT